MISDYDPAAIVRTLLRRCRSAALATLAEGRGAPYCSLVATASQPDGSPLLLISRLALHTKNLLADPRLSLLLADDAAGDPLQQPRLMLSGQADVLGGDERSRARQRYLAAHPDAAMFADFPDFMFVGVRIEAMHLVAGFGRIVDLAPGDGLTDLSDADALLAAEQDAVDHMNADHADALALYATQLLGLESGAWLCTGCDPDGLDLALDAASKGRQTARLAFPHRVTTPAELRKTLVALAQQARAAAAE